MVSREFFLEAKPYCSVLQNSFGPIRTRLAILFNNVTPEFKILVGISLLLPASASLILVNLRRFESKDIQAVKLFNRFSMPILTLLASIQRDIGRFDILILSVGRTTISEIAVWLPLVQMVARYRLECDRLTFFHRGVEWNILSAKFFQFRCNSLAAVTFELGLHLLQVWPKLIKSLWPP